MGETQYRFQTVKCWRKRSLLDENFNCSADQVVLSAASHLIIPISLLKKTLARQTWRKSPLLLTWQNSLSQHWLCWNPEMDPSEGVQSGVLTKAQPHSRIEVTQCRAGMALEGCPGPSNLTLLNLNFLLGFYPLGTIRSLKVSQTTPLRLKILSEEKWKVLACRTWPLYTLYIKRVSARLIAVKHPTLIKKIIISPTVEGEGGY